LQDLVNRQAAVIVAAINAGLCAEMSVEKPNA